jgi:hypothetical protein
MTCKMNILTRIRHIFPYLYYRLYQSMYKTARDRKPELRAFLLVCTIKTVFVFTFFILPINVIFFDNPIFFMVPIVIGIIFALNYTKYKEYQKKIVIWKNETESQRRVKFWYLVLFCAIPFILYVPIILISMKFSIVM